MIDANRKRFTKDFTLQEPICEEGIEKAVAILRSGKIHRYNVDPDEKGEAALLEEDLPTRIAAVEDRRADTANIGSPRAWHGSSLPGSGGPCKRKDHIRDIQDSSEIMWGSLSRRTPASSTGSGPGFASPDPGSPFPHTPNGRSPNNSRRGSGTGSRSSTRKSAG